MKIKFASTIRNYSWKNFPKDLIAGVITAAISIPISMGYAQIAGLPAVYGLYGSVFPILLFALFSTSPQFIFGVDAAPAALVGSALLTMEIELGSAAAVKIVPVITFWVAVWLLVFSLFKTGKLVSYISAPVMGGFITGICTEIILMQLPKLMGGTPGTGELPELLEQIFVTAKSVHVPSLLLGIAALAILITGKKLAPKFPMAVALMAAGALLTRFCPSLMKDIQTLNSVDPGLPVWSIPQILSVPLAEVVTISLSIAVVIMAETLLAENSFAMKNGYRVDNNQELLAFSIGNFSAAFTGCCPINGSVSRTAMSEQYQGKTQMTGIIAGLSMILLLVSGTGFIGYLPVPVLTAIVISALMGATEFEMVKRLWKINRQECMIFFGAFFGVLMLGTINGVLIGIILSFAEVIIRSAKPVRSFLGIQPGHKHFRDLNENSQILPLEGIVIYRFSSSLFFANVDIFQKDIEDSIMDDTKAVIVDASAIGSIDITAADRLAVIYKNLKEKGIRFYLTEHIADLNDQLRELGLRYMIEEGAVRRTIHIALKDMGITRPYPLEGKVENTERSAFQKRFDNRIQEFTWAFGKEAETVIENQIRLQVEKLKESQDIEALFHGNWGYKEAMDEKEWMDHLKDHLEEIVKATGMDEQELLKKLEKNKEEVQQRILEERPDLEEELLQQKGMLDEELKKKYPEVCRKIQSIRKAK